MPDTLDASLLVTHLNDERGLRAIRSVAELEHQPAEVVLADGGSRQELLDRYEALGEELPFHLRIVEAPGSVAASREGAWGSCKAGTIAFLDTDEVARPGWLEALTRPIREGEADMAAGPTEPLHVEDAWDEYHTQLDAWFYDNFVAQDVLYAPMGNTAWERGVFETLDEKDGHVFDTGLDRGGEDFDVNIRAFKAGFTGTYVPQAVVAHDYSNVKGYATILKKKFHYAKAETKVRQRHRAFLAGRPSVEPKEKKPFHPMELLEPFVRRWAYLKGRLDA